MKKENVKIYTHKVIDTHYGEDEGLDFVGTYEECISYKEEQSKISFANTFMLRIENLSSEEYEVYNSEIEESEEN